LNASLKRQLRLALLVTIVVVVGLVALALLVRGEPPKGMFFYDAH
jgi:hypothetical protein